VGSGLAFELLTTPDEETIMTDRQSNIDQLNSFLRGEISAVETYRQALDKVKDTRALPVLRECMQSHSQRVATLSEQIRALGGTPAEGSGPWGAFAKMMEGGAKAFGDSAAIGVLEEGEDHGLKDYQDDLPKLDGAARTLVNGTLLPSQHHTHRVMSDLKQMM
jgi:uncharacterized protein (TIGR02284 family)